MKCAWVSNSGVCAGDRERTGGIDLEDFAWEGIELPFNYDVTAHADKSEKVTF